MEHVLNEVEIRVLGSLIEKELTTPEYYPLTLNALVAACNQKSSRSPVMSLTQDDVLGAIRSLRGKHLAWEHHEAGARVPKYSHNISALAPLEQPQIALLCVLLLRGPQTPGEIRSHTSRMHTFSDLNEVQDAIEAINSQADGPFVAELPRVAGRKEARYAHLLGGEPQADEAISAPAAHPAPPPSGTTAERIDALESRISELESQLEAMREAFDRFREQFE
ncbi:MAG: DUF480 domain-containing protein [Chitinivibrionales bacterium]|nr:DUF480 domain-containing protein [Chitinivibrionales bacterium]